VAQVLMLRIS